MTAQRGTNECHVEKTCPLQLLKGRRTNSDAGTAAHSAQPRPPRPTQTDGLLQSVGLMKIAGLSDCGLADHPQTVCQTVCQLATLVMSDKAASVKELSQQNSNVHLVKGNVTDPESMLTAATEVTKITGGVG
ncbi:hypothetical protein X797_012399 [Metarhizium robertsii]|uniref:Uncharacterized protein n=1 Tax=Metarhizium robertsii TaxID=568076 RepID=A0A014QPG8_9HYPO|nr:hypothetical protein X797_012399 [Metarhizium robertsii]